MPAQQLVADRVDDIGEFERAGFTGHACKENHLEQQVAELVAERRHVLAGDRVGHLVGFLDGVWRDRREILLEVPRTAAVGIPEAIHYFK